MQQFSISAEIRHFDAVMGAMGAQNGAPRVDGSASPPLYRWDNGESKIMADGGKDLVFVAFELAGYQDAVKRKGGGARPTNECR